MTRKKIIQIIPQLNSGGAERFVIDLSNELYKSHEITLITLFPIEAHGFYLRELNPNIKVLSMNKKIGKDFLLPIRLLRIIKKEKPVIVHTHLNAFFYSLLSIIALTKINFFHTIHNTALAEAPGKYGVLIKKRMFKLKRCTPITISQSSFDSFVEVYGYHAPLIENGRAKCSLSDDFQNVQNELSNYKKTPDTKVLINVARITPQKNQKLLIDSFNEIISEGYEAILIFIGANLDEEIYNYLMKNKNDRIYYLGEKSNPIDYLTVSDAFCLSSLEEGMPISLIEAFMCKCIPVCTPAGGIVNMIRNNENGFLSSDFTKESYVNVLYDFLNLTLDQKTKFIKNINQDAYQYSIEKCSLKYLELFMGVKSLNI